MSPSGSPPNHAKNHPGAGPFVLPFARLLSPPVSATPPSSEPPPPSLTHVPFPRLFSNSLWSTVHQTNETLYQVGWDEYFLPLSTASIYFSFERYLVRLSSPPSSASILLASWPTLLLSVLSRLFPKSHWAAVNGIATIPDPPHSQSYAQLREADPKLGHLVEY